MNKDNRKKLKQFFSFGVVGGFGTVVNTALLYGLTVFIGIYYLLSSVIATEIAIISNFIGNHLLTFRDRKDPSPLKEKFVKFQLISLTTIVGTVAILWFFVTFFGQDRLILWNVIAILTMFVANFALNSKLTWRENPGAKHKHKKPFLVLGIFFMIFAAGFASADLLSVSQMGYHPESEKQIVVYTDRPGGTFTIHDGSSLVFNGPLVKAKDYSGSNVECQGQNKCLIGVFTELGEEGDYVVRTTLSSQEIEFSIDEDIYERNIPVLLEFFDAQKQQGSDYHADFHSGYTPGFTTIADGSFIMESHQASKTLIRLSSAYNRNPSAFDGEMNGIIKLHVEYLKDLQGLEIEETEFGHPGYDEGFRLIPDIKINNVFVPGLVPSWIGPTMDIYNPDETLSESGIPVVSMCGEDDGTSEWQECIDYAAKYYKCQIDEPCINATYIENTGKVVGQNGYGVAKGWSTEFGCYFDVTLREEMFTQGEMNPCLVFYPEENRENTVETLYGFLIAIPALHDEDPGYAKETFEHSVGTYEHIKSAYPSFSAGDNDAGFFGAALFKLYDYTGDESYLIEAHSLRSKVTPSVSSVFISDSTRGPEFYWEEYSLHEEDILDAGLQYEYQGKTPGEMLDDKIYFDWKDKGGLSVSRNGERVFQFDPEIKFQNSRYILTESLLATKTIDMHPSPQPFVSTVADNQLAWMTGMNGIPQGISPSSPLTSYSFIFGIGEEINPEQFHSRYLVNTGFREETDGEIIGTRGTAKKFYDGSEYIFMDGRIDMLGKTLGAVGNRYRGEAQTDLWKIGQTFANGKDHIPGWTNGAFPIREDNPHRVFNYVDTVHTYEFTETTNEIVATAVELFSYQDAIKNGRPRHAGVTFNDTSGGQINATLTVTSSPSGAEIFIDGDFKSETPAEFSLAPGTYNITATLDGHHPESEIVELSDGESELLHFDLDEIIIPQNATLFVTSEPSESSVRIDGVAQGLTPLEKSLEPGEYEVEVSKEGFVTNLTVLDLPEGETFWHVVLEPEPVVIRNGTLEVNSIPSEAEVLIEGEFAGLTPLERSLEPGEYNVEVRKDGYFSNETTAIIEENETTILDIELEQIPSGTSNGTLLVDSSPRQAEVFIDGETAGLTPLERSLEPGEYEVAVRKDGYLSNSTSVMIIEEEITIVNLSLSEIPSGTVNGTLEVYSNPDGAEVLINGDLSGITPLSESLVPGEYNVEVRKDGYLSNSTSVIIEENMTSIVNLTLEEIPGAGNVSIINHGTDMQVETNSSTGAEYRIYESETGRLFVELDGEGEVTWTIDGEEINTTQGVRHEIEFNPDILFTDSLQDSMIEASAGNDSVSWHVDVHNFINPFFSPASGREGSQINVFTNNLKEEFDNITVYIESSGAVKNYSLEAFPAGNNETAWKHFISDGEFSTGNNYLVRIETLAGSETLTFNLSTQGEKIRAFHKPPPSGGSSPGGSSPGGSGPGSSGPEEIEMIYVILESDVIGINQSQTVTLDASSTRQVRNVEAVFLIGDGGFLTQELTLTNGDRSYGTWSSTFRVPSHGLYELQEINIIGSTKNETFNVSERTFYVISDNVEEDEELVLIYTALSTGIVIEPGNVTLRLDARDYLGVERITAEVSATRGENKENFTVPLELASGDSNYGTWEAQIEITQPDTTYSVDKITLENEEVIKEYSIQGRSVYATNDLPETDADAQQNENGGLGFITGAAILPLIEDPLSHPFFPVIIGILLLFVILGASALKSKFDNKRKSGGV